MLDHSQIRFFRDAGYLKIKGAVSEQDILSLRELILSEEKEKREPLRVNEKGFVTHVESLIDRSEIFLDLIKSEPFFGALTSLLGPNITLTKNRHNHATFNKSVEQCPITQLRLHRDVFQWSRATVTAIIYLSSSNQESGCTKLIPCSQYLPFIARPNNGGTWMDEHKEFEFLVDQGLLMEARAGDILLFDSLIFHAPTENMTSKDRMSCTFSFHSVDELAKIDDEGKMLIAGEKIYKGNDKNFKKRLNE